MILPPFYPIFDIALVAARGIDSLEAARAMQDGGATIIQLRHKAAWTREVFAIAEKIAALRMQLIVNDRADMARLLNAGVHVGQTDLPPADARAIVGDAPLGYSTHNQEQLAAAATEPVDYVALGPIFETASKANPDPVVGVQTLRKLRPLIDKPLVAIGGITRANALDVREAGADSVAIIGDLYPDPLTPATLRNRIEEWVELLRK